MRGLTPAGRRREAARQQQLLEALFDPGCTQPHDAGPGWPRGLAAYRANASAHAADVLRAQYPTVLTMLGDASFDALATMHWRACPPVRGDLARFGEHFPTWLRQRRDLAAWPWLEDCARLDRALWRVRFAPPARLCDADLRLLADGDPHALRLRLAPAAELVEARWAVLSLRELHAAPAPDLHAIARVLASGPQAAWVWRKDFDTGVVALDAAAVRWFHALRRAPTLGAALAGIDDDFDVGAWLAQAVRGGWIDGVEVVGIERNIA